MSEKYELSFQHEWDLYIRHAKTLLKYMKSRKIETVSIPRYKLEEWLSIVEELKDYAFDRDLHHL